MKKSINNKSIRRQSNKFMQRNTQKTLRRIRKSQIIHQIWKLWLNQNLLLLVLACSHNININTKSEMMIRKKKSLLLFLRLKQRKKKKLKKFLRRLKRRLKEFLNLKLGKCMNKINQKFIIWPKNKEMDTMKLMNWLTLQLKRITLLKFSSMDKNLLHKLGQL